MDSVAIATMGKFTGPDILGTYTSPPPPPREEDHIFPQIKVNNVKSSYVNEQKIEVKSLQEEDNHGN